MLKVLVFASALVIGSAAAAAAEPAQRDIAPVISFSTSAPVPGAWSALVRTDSGVTMSLHTSQLGAGDAVTVWWVVFNNPTSCSHGVSGVRCGAGDLSVPATHASVIYAAGHVIGQDGVGDYGARLNVGDTSGALFGPGLVDPAGADVHLIVRDHGPADPSLMPAQIHSFDICNGSCTNVQHSQHES